MFLTSSILDERIEKSRINLQYALDKEGNNAKVCVKHGICIISNCQFHWLREKLNSWETDWENMKSKRKFHN